MNQTIGSIARTSLIILTRLILDIADTCSGGQKFDADETDLFISEEILMLKD